MKKILIRKASLEDTSAIKEIADQNKEILGFIRQGILQQNIERGWILVASCEGIIVGFASYRHCKDGRTVLYNICVKQERRREGIGKLLLQELEREALFLGKEKLLLKCPEGVEANHFYPKLGYVLLGLQDGKVKKLNLWGKLLT